MKSVQGHRAYCTAHASSNVTSYRYLFVRAKACGSIKNRFFFSELLDLCVGWLKLKVKLMIRGVLYKVDNEQLSDMTDYLKD